MVGQRLEALGFFMSRALHLRLQAMYTAPAALERLGGTDAPAFQLFGLLASSVQANGPSGLLAFDPGQSHSIPSQLLRAVIDQRCSPVHVTCWSYPDEKVDRELLGMEAGDERGVVIFAADPSSAAICVEARTPLKNPSNDDRFAVRLLIADKKGSPDYLNYCTVR